MAARHEYTLGDVDFVQPKALHEKVMTDEDREHLIGTTVAHLGGAQKRIQLRQTALFYEVTRDCGTGSRRASASMSRRSSASPR